MFRSERKPSTLAWVLVHLIYPLLPFLLEGAIRWVIESQLSFTTFSASTLAMSLGLLSIFINQSLHTADTPLSNDVEDDSLLATATVFLVLAISFFVLFALLVAFGALVKVETVDPIVSALRVFQVITFVGAAIPIITGIAVQRSFKLRASLT